MDIGLIPRFVLKIIILNAEIYYTKKKKLIY